MWEQPVRSDTAQLEISLTDLASLPQGAGYQAKHGRANVRAYLKPQGGGNASNPTLIIESSCDSLERLCLWYQDRGDSLQRQLDYMEKVMARDELKADITALERSSKGINMDLVIAMICAGVGILIMCLIKKKV